MACQRQCKPCEALGRTDALWMPEQGHRSTVWSVAFSPDGRSLASGSGDFSVRIWDLATGRQQRVFDEHTGPVWSVVYSPDGRLLASGSYDGTIRLWDVEKGQRFQLLRG